MAPSTTSTSTFTIQPWTNESTNTNNPNDVLSRAQRGHFRNITESSLQQELATEGALSSSSEDSSDDGEESRDEEKKQPALAKPSTREHLYDAKRYMLQTVEAARQEVSVAQDLMSLVVSKNLPAQASTTLDHKVSAKVPLGSLGVDLWQRMPADPAREAQDRLLAANVKMDGLQSAADGLLGAAKRMEENVRRETQYWDEILSISSRGWNVCRIPGQQHRLGVHFGFSESAPQFSRKGIAALNPDRDGGIRLERGVGSRPRALRAVLRSGKDGKVVGVRRVPEVRDGDVEEETTLEARIRHARDSLFDEEVFHEALRESRTLSSVGVEVEGDTVRLRNINAAGEGLEISLGLVSLDEDNTIPDADHERDSLAQATVLTARLLLSQAHRDRLRKRSEPPAPLSEKQKDEKAVLPVLRPLLSLMLHRSALDQLTAYLTSTAVTLKAAKIEHTIQRPRLPSPVNGADDGNAIVTAEALLTTTLLRPLVSSADLTLTSPARDPETPAPGPQTFTVTLSTSLASSFGPVYTLQQPRQGKLFTFQDFPSFTSATSALLSSALAGLLLPLAQKDSDAGEDEWKFREEEAVVERDVGVDEVEQKFEVDFDGVRGELRLVWQGAESKSFHWKAQAGDDMDDGERGESEGFFNAARGCLT